MAYIGKEPQFTQYPSKFFNGDGTAMTISLDYVPPNDAAILVFIDGVRQDTSAYSCSGSSLTFTGSVPSGSNNVQVVHLGLSVDVGTVGDGTVTSAKIADGAIVNADINASASIAMSKLATDPTNASNLASGTVPTARLGSGTASSSTVLHGNNTWSAPPKGGLQHVTTVYNSSDSSSIDLAGCFTSDYNTYRLIINDIKPNTNTVHIEFQFGNSDLSSIWTRYQYVTAMWSASLGAENFYHDNSNSSSGIRIANDMSNSSVYGCNFAIDIHNPYKDDVFTSFHGQGWGFNNSGNYANTYMVIGNTMSADLSDRDESLRIVPQSGTLKGETSAHVTLYGYAES